jgi:hypothetical protein
MGIGIVRSAVHIWNTGAARIRPALPGEHRRRCGAATSPERDSRARVGSRKTPSCCGCSSMIEVGPGTEHEMIAALLQAEIRSSRATHGSTLSLRSEPFVEGARQLRHRMLMMRAQTCYEGLYWHIELPRQVSFRAPHGRKEPAPLLARPLVLSGSTVALRQCGRCFRADSRPPGPRRHHRSS